MAKLFSVQASVVSAQDLADKVLSRYSLKGESECRYFARGVNDTYVVSSGKHTFYLRVYRFGWRRRGEIEAEIDMLNALRRDGQPVSYPIKRRDGRFLTPIRAPEGTRYAVLFSAAVGRPPNFDDLNTCRQYGELCAKTHAAMDRRPIDTRRFHIDMKHLLDDSMRSIEPFMSSRTADLKYLQSVCDDLKEKLSGIPTTTPYYGFCHGDHHGGNVFQNREGIMTLFDFDCYGYGWRAYDLAVFRWAHALRHGFRGTDKAKVTRKWNAFIAGYSTVREFTQKEQNASESFVPARHIWLMGLHASLTRDVGSMILGPPAMDRHLGIIRDAMAACKK